MSHPKPLAIVKWPFLLGDALLLGLAWFIFSNRRPPMTDWEIFGYILCVALGATLAIIPFVLEYRAGIRLEESEKLATTVSQIQGVEEIASRISEATARWQTIQESADKTNRGASEIAERMAAEVKGFTEFMAKANDGEKSALRLEVDKLRRAEAEWLQVLVRMLDHVYALHHAALHSRKPALIEQLGRFQSACRDAARRVGLTPFVAESSEPFDSRRHQLADADHQPAADSIVQETLATGYTFQGKLLRPALVRLRNGDGAPEPVSQNGAADEELGNETRQSELSLDALRPQPAPSSPPTENEAGIL